MEMSGKIRHILMMAICGLLLSLPAYAQSDIKGKVAELQTEMYRLFYQDDSVAFRKVISDLMEATKKADDDVVFYRAWGNLSIYESTHQRRTHALEIARKMESYAQEHNSIFGQYTAIHVTGTVYQQ